MSWEFWPQYLVIAMYGFDFAFNCAKHGQQKDGKHSVWVSALSIAFSVVILRAGGFFG